MNSSLRSLVVPVFALALAIIASPSAFAAGPSCDLSQCKLFASADCDPSDCIPCDLCPDDCKDACPAGYVTCTVSAKTEAASIEKADVVSAVTETAKCETSGVTCCKALAQVEPKAPQSSK